MIVVGRFIFFFFCYGAQWCTYYIMSEDDSLDAGKGVYMSICNVMTKAGTSWRDCM